MSEQAFKIHVNTHEYLVEVGDLSASPVTVTVNGRSYQVDVATVAVTADPINQQPQPAKNGTPSLNGGFLPHPENGQAHAAFSIRAPMPGQIIDIAVQAGEHVQMGQILCALEAMKMKNAIRAPRAGTMGEVSVSNGQSVTHGDILFTLT